MRNRKVLLKCRLCVTNEEQDKRTVPLSEEPSPCPGLQRQEPFIHKGERLLLFRKIYYLSPTASALTQRAGRTAALEKWTSEKVSVLSLYTCSALASRSAGERTHQTQLGTEF